MAEIIVVSDVGGHKDYLDHILVKHAKMRNSVIPEDVHLVINGDIVHKGPDSEGCLELTAELLEKNDNITVTIGNHEANYLARPEFWPHPIAEGSQRLLHDLWDSGKLKVGVALDTEQGQHLVTHAGLSWGYWSLALQEPATPQEAANRLEWVRAEKEDYLWVPGCMISGDVNLAAGPIWAASSEEVIPSWVRASLRSLPSVQDFHQIHGHSNIFHWAAQRWYLAETYRDMVDLYAGPRKSVTTIAGNRIHGIDPGHTAKAAPRNTWAPLVLTGQVLPLGPTLVPGL